MPLGNWCSIRERWSVAFFPILLHIVSNFIAYRSSKVSDCIFEIHQLWQSGFGRVYSNCCCSYSFEPEIIKIGQSSRKMYSNNILNSQESTTTLNTCTKKVWKPIECTTYILFKCIANGCNVEVNGLWKTLLPIYIYVCVCVCVCVCACVCLCVCVCVCVCVLCIDISVGLILTFMLKVNIAISNRQQ